MRSDYYERSYKCSAAWDEYMSIEKNTYVEFNPNAGNKVIDFNEIQPEGFTSALAFPYHTNFNNWTLKNLHSVANTVISVKLTSYFSNLIIENFYYRPQGSICGFIAPENSGQTTLTNCIISGKIEAPNSSSVSAFLSGNFHECSLNIVINVANLRIASDCINSDIVIDATATGNFRLFTGKVINSRISGKIDSAQEITMGDDKSDAYNVFNLQTNQPINYPGNGISIYNSDIAKSSKSSTNAFVSCDTGQLRDAQYLHSIRFPIGVD